MKTIEQGYKEHLLSRQTANGRKETGSYPPRSYFNAGVKFAQQWISVDDELPDSTKVFIKITIKGDADSEDSYDYSVGVFYKGNWDVFFGKNRPITHWRPIELK